jgi:hypothetical protein
VLNVSAIARSNGLDRSQLFARRRKAKAAGVVVPLAAAPSGPIKFVRSEAMRSDMVEIVIGDVVVRAGSDLGRACVARMKMPPVSQAASAPVCRQFLGRDIRSSDRNCLARRVYLKAAKSDRPVDQERPGAAVRSTPCQDERLPRCNKRTLNGT